MKILKTTFLFLFTFPLFNICFSQSDSCKLRISLLTCSPGEELYSAWGHTAIRVTDRTTGMDMVFNYGTFDDSDPDFYLKFTRGLMIYALSAYPFSNFLEEYKSQGRGIIEQTLSLSCADKTRLFSALRINALQENRFYEYYFSTDNCTTRAKDMIVKNTAHRVTFNSIISNSPPSFRNLIHSYLDKRNQAWSKLGIDILLGSNLDKKVTNDQAMFLPDYLMKGFAGAHTSTQPLVTETITILTTPDPSQKSNGILTPGIIFSVFAVFIAVLSFFKGAGSQKVLNVFDTLFFLLLGLLGVLLLVLWVIRIDDVCRNNFNLLWAFPLHVPAAFVIRKRTKWVKYYFKLIVLLTTLTAAAWWLIPQQLNTTIALLLAIILIRAWQRSK
jgi:hypothetical protein